MACPMISSRPRKCIWRLFLRVWSNCVGFTSCNKEFHVIFPPFGRVYFQRASYKCSLSRASLSPFSLLPQIPSAFCTRAQKSGKVSKIFINCRQMPTLCSFWMKWKRARNTLWCTTMLQQQSLWVVSYLLKLGQIV